MSRSRLAVALAMAGSLAWRAVEAVAESKARQARRESPRRVPLPR
ncbi:hypothetical protein [Nonomuraea dietziae]